MIRQSFFLFFIFTTGLFCSVIQLSASESGKTQSIGFYTAGCIKNADALPADGTGYQVIRLSRKRYYGHSDLIRYIQSLAHDVTSRLGSTLLIGDLSMQKGGPLPDDHNSHQIGLDADILFWQHFIAAKRILAYPEREKIEPLSLLTPDLAAIDESKWDLIDGEILKLAASSEKIDRIFVNPLIKRRICGTYQGEDWLRKIRPWWGHDGHFHVRLRCPVDSPLCQTQESVPPGDGCGADLDSWFTKKAQGEKKKSIGRAQRKLPKECLIILSE
jgi:penicillin-insensitive murein endopeptidase